MTEKELELCRCKYVIIKNEKENYLSLQEELKQLKENPSVKRYLELLNLISDSKDTFTQDNMVRYAFNDITGNSNTDCDVYIYLKTYRYINNTKLLQSERMPIMNLMYFNELYSEYMNLETGKNTKVRFRDREEFEKNNTVILPPDNLIIDDYTKYAENIRLWYLNVLLNTPQDVAVLRLVNPQTINKFFE